MTTRWTLTFDCADARGQAAFWIGALGYAEAPPPKGFDSWETWLRELEVPEAEWDDGATIDDPDGVLPRITFNKVPEGKTAKNRVHLDLQVSGGRSVDHALREARIRSKVDELVAAGATIAWEDIQPYGLDHILMQDPEGNEFCVV